ncbi:MAG: helix-turn-helix domain-containing protein [Methylococcaceae bacterium]|nr:helix-turn-helix domain-containing protein [Methylococcaceae bacterium]
MCWLLEHEVLAILEISRQSVYNLRKSGVLPFYKLGNKTRYKVEDVEALVESRTTPKLQDTTDPVTKVVPRKFKPTIPVPQKAPQDIMPHPIADESMYYQADDYFI